MKILSHFWSRKTPKPLIMEPKMNDEVLRSKAEVLRTPVNRAVAAYQALSAAHASAQALIAAQDAKMVADAAVIAELKSILDAHFPEVGQSMGGAA